LVVAPLVTSAFLTSAMCIEFVEWKDSLAIRLSDVLCIAWQLAMLAIPGSQH